MMIDAACRQSSYLLPLLTNTGNSNNKMKRNLRNNNEDELTSSSVIGIRANDHKKLLPPRKKLKFGVDAILGTNSDNESSFDAGNESDDDLRHKGKRSFFPNCCFNTEICFPKKETFVKYFEQMHDDKTSYVKVEDYVYKSRISMLTKID